MANVIDIEGLIQGSDKFSFSSNDTLISKEEVICHAPTSGRSYAEERCNFMAMKEEKLFEKCFGWELYLKMMKSKIRYSLDPNDQDALCYVNFQENVVYNKGNLVLYKGVIYYVSVPTTGVEIPDRAPYFIKAPKFNNTSYNYVWERYLCRLIAFSIMHTSVMYRLVKDTPMGVVKNYQEGKSDPATLKELMALKSEMIGDIDDFIINMENFMRKHPSCFEGYKGFENCATGCAPRKQHYGFNTNRRRIR